MKIQYDSLVFEVTRRCNMSCAHCLRGKAQKKDMSFDVIDKALEMAASINCITFTGGEPSLNVPAIMHALDVCKQRSIEVYNFYIVTNGKEVSDEFLLALLRWNAYTAMCGSEEDFNGVALSRDVFHDYVPPENEKLLRSLSFFREDKFTDWEDIPLINAGNAKTLSGFTKRAKQAASSISVEQYEDAYIINDGITTVTVDGDILADCDYAYEDVESIKLGTVFDMQWIEKQYKQQTAA